MMNKSLFRRELPSPPCISFECNDGKRLFTESLVTQGMNVYFQIAQHFLTQDEPAFCGVSTLVMVLNSLHVKPRFSSEQEYREHLLGDCCVPLEEIKENGINFDELACLARCHGLCVDAVRTTSCEIHDFRAVVKQVCSSKNERLIVSYSRRGLKQTGDGHFSPIGGYHDATDSVLIMDVARFKYPPHWVSLSVLYRAMEMVDASTGLARGYMHIRVDQTRTQSSTVAVFAGEAKLQAIRQKWASLKNEVYSVLSCSQCSNDCGCVGVGDDDSDADVCDAVKCAVSNSCSVSQLIRDMVVVENVDPNVLRAAQASDMYREILSHTLPDHDVQCDQDCADNEDHRRTIEESAFLAIVLLSLPRGVWRLCGQKCTLGPYLSSDSLEALPSILKNEISTLRSQLSCILACAGQQQQTS